MKTITDTKQASEQQAAKKQFTPPQLTEYGDAAKITRGNLSGGVQDTPFSHDFHS